MLAPLVQLVADVDDAGVGHRGAFVLGPVDFTGRVGKPPGALHPIKRGRGGHMVNRQGRTCRQNDVPSPPREPLCSPRRRRQPRRSIRRRLSRPIYRRRGHSGCVRSNGPRRSGGSDYPAAPTLLRSDLWHQHRWDHRAGACPRETSLGTTAGYEETARSRSAPRASGTVFLHTAHVTVTQSSYSPYSHQATS